MAERELVKGVNEKYHALRRARAATCGVRTAHQIIADGHVDNDFGCIDLNTVIMAVLRHRGVPCRTVYLTTRRRFPSTTSIVEVELSGRHYRIQPLLVDGDKRVRPGLVKRGLDGQEILTGKDHAATGLEFHEAIVQSQADWRRLAEESG